jgi:hypothetical protein
MRRRSGQLLCAALLAVSFVDSSAQTPVPFPRPGQPATPPAQKPAEVPPLQPPTASAPAGEPSEATLGVPVYPAAEFVASFDAGRGQRYYLFGTNTPFADIVAYYRTVLKQRGELVFEAPAIHMFELGRFREETMAFPPSVTVKDYTWGGSQGYLNPKRGAKPARFSTIIQIVPVPPGAGR